MSKNCIVCNSKFDPGEGISRWRVVVCGEECRHQRALANSRKSWAKNHQRVKRQCVICGKKFIPKTNAVTCCMAHSIERARRYRRAYGIAKRAATPKKILKKICIICSREFEAMAGTRKACGPGCRTVMNRETGRVWRSKNPQSVRASKERRLEIERKALAAYRATLQIEEELGHGTY